VLFLERDKPWYADNRDLPEPAYGATELYYSVSDLKARFEPEVAEADCVIVGSYVPDGIEICKWVLSTAKGVRAFYDIDTPVTLAALENEKCEYLDLSLMQDFDLYLSFTGGPTLSRLEEEFHVQRARAFYCSADLSTHYPEAIEKRYDLGYLGTYSPDRQPTLQRLLITPATKWPEGRFIVAGPQFPQEIAWPDNVKRISHLAPDKHREFYNQQRFTLNVTRADMIRAGFSPSVRLFEAAACGTPIISDRWDGIETLFQPGSEVLLADNEEEVIHILRDLKPEEAAAIGERARQRVLAEHTAAHRAVELEILIAEARVPKLVV
jgi:spore maturation protein CgeB